MDGNKLLNEFIKLNRSYFSPQPFVFSAVAIFISQFVMAKDWIHSKIGDFNYFGYFVAILILLVGLDLIINSHVFSFRKITTVTSLDICLYGAIWVLITNAFLFWYQGINNKLFLFFQIGIIIILIGYECYRLYKFSKVKDIENELINLNQLLNANDISVNEKFPIIVDERAVDYDLFDRDAVKNELLNAIKCFSSSHSYTVGLVGKWGSGKTTILNLAKKEVQTTQSSEDSQENKIVFINAPGSNNTDFNLWLFGSQEAMIKGMYETILSGMGVKYNWAFNDKTLENVAKVVSGIPKVGNMVGSALPIDSASYLDVVKLKNRLTDYIRSTGKHYVMCIEDLDRADDDQVVLFLKLINTVFDLPCLTYVLLYDKERLDRILRHTQKMNVLYSNKVINQEITIPTMLDKEKCWECLHNLLELYGIPQNRLKEYDFVLDVIINNLSSVRDLKRIINSVFVILADKDNFQLNLPQLLAIQYIYFSCPKLYKEISHHKDEFTYKVKYSDSITYIPQVITPEENKYFNDIAPKYVSYMNLLKGLFYKIRIYSNNKIQNTDKYNDDLRKISIEIPDYFNSYFLLDDTDDIRIVRKTNNFIDLINNTEDIDSVWQNLISKNDSDTVKEMLNKMNIFTNRDIITESKKREQLAEILFNSIDVNKKENISWLASIEYSILNIVSELIVECGEKDFSVFRKAIHGRYNMLSAIADIVYYMKHTYSGLNSNIDDMQKVFDEMCKEILNNTVNLYSDYNYSFGNTYSFYDYWDQKDDKNILKYLNKIVSSKNVYRILFDTFSFTVNESDEYGYKVNKQVYDRMQLSQLFKLNDLLNEKQDMNNDQKRVVDIYQRYISNEENAFSYYVDEINPNNL